MKIGEYNELRINRMVDFGAYLIDEDTHEVLLPKRYLTPEMKLGDAIKVFVYNDSENRPVATTEVPRAVVGDFALMRVKAVNKVGAFLDWGLTAKDLLVPFRHCRQRQTRQVPQPLRARLLSPRESRGAGCATQRLGLPRHCQQCPLGTNLPERDLSGRERGRPVHGLR